MLKHIALVLLLLLPAAGWGDRLPGHYPRHVMHQGNIDAVDFSTLSVFIDDTKFYISPTTQFMTPGRRQATHAELQVGKQAGCNYRMDENRRRMLTEVWILPAGASFERR